MAQKRPLQLPPEPHFLSGDARLTTDHGGPTVAPEGKSGGRSPRIFCSDLRFHGRHRRRELFLQTFERWAPHRGNKDLVRSRIDPHRRHPGLGAQKTHEFFHPHITRFVARNHATILAAGNHNRKFICAAPSSIHWLADSFS